MPAGADAAARRRAHRRAAVAPGGWSGGAQGDALLARRRRLVGSKSEGGVPTDGKVQVSPDRAPAQKSVGGVSSCGRVYMLRSAWLAGQQRIVYMLLYAAGWNQWQQS